MKSFRVAFVLALGFSLPVVAQAPEEMRRLLDQQKPEEAYQLGRRTPERLGDPAFDFPFGVAAIGAGRAAEGVLALERFVLGFPDHDAARVELARGYYLLGEDARAKEEFEAAMARKPSPELGRIIAEYLQAIRDREAKYRPTAMAYFEAGAGFDSNPRAGVDNALITLPVLGEVTVVDTGLRVGDQSRTAAAGFRVTGPLSARALAFAAGQAEMIRYPDLVEFDQEVYAGSAGVQGKLGSHNWRTGASVGYQTLNRTAYRRTHGVFGDWSTPLGERNAVSAGAQVGQFQFEGVNAVRDAHFRSLSLGWKHFVPALWRSEFDLSANAGREKNIFEARQDLSRDVYGARLGITASPWAGWTLAASALHQRSDYLEADAVLQTAREDRYSAGDLSLAWSVWNALQLRAEFSAAKNDSNLALYEYRRKTALMRVRYEFR